MDPKLIDIKTLLVNQKALPADLNDDMADPILGTISSEFTKQQLDTLMKGKNKKAFADMTNQLAKSENILKNASASPICKMIIQTAHKKAKENNAVRRAFYDVVNTIKPGTEKNPYDKAASLADNINKSTVLLGIEKDKMSETLIVLATSIDKHGFTKTVKDINAGKYTNDNPTGLVKKKNDKVTTTAKVHQATQAAAKKVETVVTNVGNKIAETTETAAKKVENAVSSAPATQDKVATATETAATKVEVASETAAKSIESKVEGVTQAAATSVETKVEAVTETAAKAVETKVETAPAVETEKKVEAATETAATKVEKPATVAQKIEAATTTNATTVENTATIVSNSSLFKPAAVEPVAAPAPAVTPAPAPTM